MRLGGIPGERMNAELIRELVEQQKPRRWERRGKVHIDVSRYGEAWLITSSTPERRCKLLVSDKDLKEKGYTEEEAAHVYAPIIAESLAVQSFPVKAAYDPESNTVALPTDAWESATKTPVAIAFIGAVSQEEK
jgi:hypothetical protein